MIIKNPTDKDVAIVIEGHDYVVSANGELAGLREEHAFIWKKVHGFLQIKKEEVAEVKVVVTPPEHIIKEKKEEAKVPVKKVGFIKGLKK